MRLNSLKFSFIVEYGTDKIGNEEVLAKIAEVPVYVYGVIRKEEWIINRK